MGRPATTMTEEACALIVRAVGLGLSLRSAADVAGLNYGTVTNHRRRNEAFATAIKQARGAGKQSLVAKIHAHSERQWQAAAWLLERIWPAEFSKREHVEVSTKGEAQKLLDDLHQIRQRNEGKSEPAQ